MLFCCLDVLHGPAVDAISVMGEDKGGRTEDGYTKKASHFRERLSVWELRDSNPRPSACKADALNQLS